MVKQSKKANQFGPLAWAVCVVSSAAQEDTLPHQRAWAEAEAKSKGWRLERMISDTASGKSGVRKPVLEMLADIKALEPAARPQWLLMIRLDRLGRGEIVDSQIILSELKRLGVKVFTRDGGEVKNSSATDALINTVRLYVSNQENEVRSDKMKAVRKRKREAGEAAGRIPYGLMRKGAKNVADPDRAFVVKEAFKMRLEGKGYMLIGRRLSAIAPSAKFMNGKETVTHWTPSRLAKLFKNRDYVGTVVNEATWARAQQVGTLLTNAPKNGEAQTRIWPLSGILKCYCGRTLVGMFCGTHPWRYTYYACRAIWNHNGRHLLVRAEQIENQFVDLLGRLRASPHLITKWSGRSTAAQTKALQSRLSALSSDLAKTQKQREHVWELHDAGKVRSEDVQERLDQLASKRDEAEAAIRETKEQLAIDASRSGKQKDVEALFRRAAEIFTRSAPRRQQEIARAVAIELGGLVVDNERRLTPAGKASA